VGAEVLGRYRPPLKKVLVVKNVAEQRCQDRGGMVGIKEAHDI